MRSHQFLAGDLVMRSGQTYILSIVECHGAEQLARCVWYEGRERHEAMLPFSELIALADHALRAAQPPRLP